LLAIDKENTMYEKENEFVPLNFDALMKNPEVLKVILEEMQYLSGECLMKIITAAKEQGLKDKQIFMPTEEVVKVEFVDPFDDSMED
jgi:hypothetical protein